MLDILFFASYRESLEVDSIQMEFTDSCTVQDLINNLSSKGDIWQQTLSQENVKIAINQQMATLASTINDGDEIAFFPPVTGG